MLACSGLVSSLVHFVSTVSHLLKDVACLTTSNFRSRNELAAENLFLRKQLALYQERGIKPRRAVDATRLCLVVLARFFDWRSALVTVKPDTLVRWHRKGFRLFWRWKSRPRGRPPLPANLRNLIETMADDNPTWGEARIADELLLKLGLKVSPRSVGKYLRERPRGRAPDPAQRWLTYIRNHAQAVVACDFFVVVTASFRVLYVFVALEQGRRRILHHNVTTHPTAEWTLQQFREAIPADHSYRFVIHDRDQIFSKELDEAVTATGVRVLRTPVRSPLANSICERLIGTIRRECLDFMIPLGQRHLKRILREWIRHYNRGRPHSSLGPGIPDAASAVTPLAPNRHLCSH